MIEKNAVVRPEKIELMEFLVSKGIRIACYTNSIRMTAEMMLSKTGVKEYMELILTNQDVEKSKPDPEGYLKCLEYFGTTAEETIIVEDSPKGYAAAKASGCVCIRVENQEEVDKKLLEEYV